MREALASAVVSGGFGLMELRPAHLSLEEIFLQLTTSDTASDNADRGMRNTGRSRRASCAAYFLSPLAYLVIALFLSALGCCSR